MTGVFGWRVGRAWAGSYLCPLKVVSHCTFVPEEQSGCGVALGHEPLVSMFLSLAWGRHSLACGVGQGAGRGMTHISGLGGRASLLHPQALSWRQALRSPTAEGSGRPSFASNLPIYSQVPKPSQAVATCLCQPGFSCTPDPSPGAAREGLGPPAPPRYHVDYYCCVACSSPRVRPRARRFAARGACAVCETLSRQVPGKRAEPAQGVVPR